MKNDKGEGAECIIGLLVLKINERRNVSVKCLKHGKRKVLNIAPSAVSRVLAHIYHSSHSILASALLLAAIKTQGYKCGEKWLKVHTFLCKATALILYSISCFPQKKRQAVLAVKV